MRFLEKYIPGKPNLMVEFIEGAAGRKAANVIYSSTRPDGLTIGSIGAGLVVGPILGLPGSNYDLDKFIYLGSTDAGDPYIFYTKGDLGLDTIEKLRASQRPQTRRSCGWPSSLCHRPYGAYLLGLKDPKFVTGYTGPEIYIAITRGELDAHATGAARFVMEQSRVDREKTGALPCDSDGSQGPPSPNVCTGAGIRELCQVRDGAKATRHVPRLPISALAVHISSGNAQRSRSDHPRSHAQVVCRIRNFPRSFTS